VKKIVLYIILSIFTFGCEVYQLDTYPTLDGTYKLTSVTMTVNENQTTNYIHPGEFVWFPNIYGPLEELVIDETKIHFSGNELYAGLIQNDFGDLWVYNYFIRINNDLITGRWDNFTVINYPTPLNYYILEDGVTYLKLKRNEMYYDSDGVMKPVEYILIFYREGA
jgi:hypothetical protein